MGLSIVLVKVMTIIAVISISSFIAVSYLAYQRELQQLNLIESDILNSMKIFKSILVQAYFEKAEYNLQVINLGMAGLRVEVNPVQFTISMPNDSLSWMLNQTSLCFSSTCDHNPAASVGSGDFIIERGYSLISTVNLFFNVTDSGVKRYVFFITHVTADPLILAGKVKIKVMISKLHDLVATRFFSGSTTINFMLNNVVFHSQSIEPNSYVMFYIVNARLSIWIEP